MRKTFALICLFVVGCSQSPVEKRVDIESVMDAVVHIEVTAVSTSYDGYEYEQTWQGSGAFIAPNIILTAGHVVNGAKSAIITLRDGTKLSASIFYEADNADVGFICVDYESSHVLKFSQSKLKLLDTVYICGHPLGWMNNWTVSEGVVSCLERDCEGFFGEFLMLQSDAASYPGNSGGPVVDEKGEIVGVLVGGINGTECLSYIVPAEIADQWEDVFREWLECPKS